MPIFREGAPIGAIALGQNASGGFTDTQIELLKTFAEQAVIAIASAETYRALQERTAALAQRNSEHGERIEQQSATIDVLKVMSGSPGDTRPVFELVVERAREFCNADYAAAALAQGGMLHLQAASGMTEGIAQGFAAMFPRSVGTDTLLGRAILSGAAMQSADVMADPEHFSHGGAVFPTRSVVAVPLWRGGSAIGALTLARWTQGECSATQMELLRTFADQAVIAITSAETYRAMQIRRADLQESLEYQTATSAVLKVIQADPRSIYSPYWMRWSKRRHGCAMQTWPILLVAKERRCTSRPIMGSHRNTKNISKRGVRRNSTLTHRP